MIFGRKAKDLKRNWQRSQKRTLLTIAVPKGNEKTPLAAESMFAALHGIYRAAASFQSTLSFEIAAISSAVNFYVSIPAELKEFVEGQIYSQYPAVEIYELEDYTAQIGTANFVGCDLIVNREDVYPIKTFTSFEVDPLAAVTGALGQIRADEQIWLQVVVEPVADDWQARGVDYVKAIRSGQDPHQKLSRVILKGAVSVAAAVFKTALSSPSSSVPASSEEAKTVQLSAPAEAALKGIEQKITKLGFLAKIRIIALARSQSRAYELVNRVAGVYKQFSMTNLNSFSAHYVAPDPNYLENYQQRVLGEKPYVLNIEELASVYHFPNITVETPTIVWAGSRKGEPPANLPVEGMIEETQITYFGATNFRQMIKRFGIKQRDRGLHMYAIGKTGTGKSTLLENMIIDDIKKGRGVAVVDPHGDLIKNVLKFIPPERVDDVLLFSPADCEFPVGFNLLENVDPELKNIVASGVVGIFKKLYAESWGPRLEYILRNVILGLLDCGDATLLSILRVLVDSEYRRSVVEKIKDPVVKSFFIYEYEKYDQQFRTEAIAPIQNKVGQFLSSSTIRNIVGQIKSTIDINRAMNERKILLLDLSIGKIGEDNSALLGAMMITKIQLAAMSRANLPPEERTDFYLYVDEFQNFATEAFAIILSEARKYRLNIIMTNQYIAQMPEQVASAVFGNVGTIVCFRVGAADAAALVREFEPTFTAPDLVNLDNFQVYIKMAIDGITSLPFSATTLSPAENPYNLIEQVVAASRQKYGKSRGEVEAQINQWADFESLQEAVAQIGQKKKKRTSGVEVGEAQLREGKVHFRSFPGASGARWYYLK